MFFTEKKYPFVTEQSFSTVGRTIEIKPKVLGSQIAFVYEDQRLNLLGLYPPVS